MSATSVSVCFCQTRNSKLDIRFLLWTVPEVGGHKRTSAKAAVHRDPFSLSILKY